MLEIQYPLYNGANICTSELTRHVPIYPGILRGEAELYGTFTQTMVDMTVENPVNEILAIQFRTGTQ